MGKYLNRLGKLTIYHSFILSNFNYCPVIWHFCSEANTKKMEKIQERALKFIYNENHSTYEELLAKSKLPSLKIRIAWNLLGFTFIWFAQTLLYWI
jgi:hypothetical protein